MSVEEDEKPAKRYQINAIQKELKGINTKLDQILEAQKNYVTHTELESTEKLLKDYTDEKFNTVETKYGPIYKLFWALISAVCIEAALLAFQLTRG